MSPRLVTLGMIGLLILGIAAQGWAQITRSYSNAWDYTTGRPGEQNFGDRRNIPWNFMTSNQGKQTYQNFGNPWTSDNSGPGLGIQVSPTFKGPWGATTFGPGTPGENR